MQSLLIAWEYLTGYAVAAYPGSRERAEWPPHPGRLYMALAAAWFETEPVEGDVAALRAWEAERDALCWLESLDEPHLYLPPFERVGRRTSVTTFVPVNDRAGPASATVQSVPSITRTRQPRNFPCTWVGEGPCFMHWPVADSVEQHRTPLARLCSKVTRIGHSSSLVRMWVADDAQQTHLAEEMEQLLPDAAMPDVSSRSIVPGLLDMLGEQYGEQARRRHDQLTEQIDALKAERKAAKGKGAKERKASLDEQVAQLEAERSATVPRLPVRPTLGAWSGYRRAERAPKAADAGCSHFDSDILVLSHVGGPQLPLTAMLTVAKALRNTIMSRSAVQPVPTWVSGHEPDGSPSEREDGHLAIVPLAHVGHVHADGHLLGVGLVFPKSVPREERGQVLAPLLTTPDGEFATVTLTLGQLGAWSVRLADWTDKRSALQPELWTARAGREGRADGATTWASVTPVVLDRFPKADRNKDRNAWTEEVESIVAMACTRIIGPSPQLVAIDIDTTSWHKGSARAIAKQRPLRGDAAAASHLSAAASDGFPPYPAKGTNGPRVQVHVWLRFAAPVVGPILLGAGRYRGYGLCKPLREAPQ